MKFLSIATAASLAAVGMMASAHAADVTLRLASVATESSPWVSSQEAFKRELEQRTNGRVTIQIFNNNTLGSNREALTGC